MIHPAMWMSEPLESGHPNLNAWYLGFFHSEDRNRDIAGGIIASVGGAAVMSAFIAVFKVGMSSPFFYLPILFSILVVVATLVWLRQAKGESRPWRKELRKKVLTAMRQGAIYARTGQITLDEARAKAPILEEAATYALKAEKLFMTETWKSQSLALVNVEAKEAVDRAMVQAVVAAHMPGGKPEIESIQAELKALVQEIEGLSVDTGRALGRQDTVQESLRSVRFELKQLNEARRELAVVNEEIPDNTQRQT